MSASDLAPGALPEPGAGPGSSGGTPGGAPPRLARIELLDGHGHVQHVHDVYAWPVHLGRALDNHLVLADPHVAAHHAVLAPDAQGVLQLTVLDSRNGARIEPPPGQGAIRRRLAAGQSAGLSPDARAQLGRSWLRVQRAEDPLPAELPLGNEASLEAPRWQMPLLVVGAGAWLGITLWLEHRPDAKPLEQAGPLLGLGGALMAWAGLWGLLTKLFAGRFVMLAHLRLALSALMLSALAGFVLPALGFMLDLPLLSRLRGPVNVVLVAWLLARHLAIVAPRLAPRMAGAMAVFALSVVGYQMASQWQRNDRLFGELYATMLLPPSLRLAAPEPVEQAVQRLKSLEAPLAERARQAREEEFEP